MNTFVHSPIVTKIISDYEELDFAEIFVVNSTWSYFSSAQVVASRGSGYLREHAWQVETHKVS
jgi:hypothetical protein